jgi:hypothetical protein
MTDTSFSSEDDHGLVFFSTVQKQSAISALCRLHAAVPTHCCRWGSDEAWQPHAEMRPPYQPQHQDMSRVVDQLLGAFYGKPSSRKRKESHLLISATSAENIP